MKKVLVAYFSASGVTRTAAEALAAAATAVRIVVHYTVASRMIYKIDAIIDTVCKQIV